MSLDITRFKDKVYVCHINLSELLLRETRTFFPMNCTPTPENRFVKQYNLLFFIRLLNSDNYLIRNLICHIYDSTRICKSINWILQNYELENLSIFAVDKCDIKHIFKCIVTRKAMLQYETLFADDDDEGFIYDDG